MVDPLSFEIARHSGLRPFLRHARARISPQSRGLPSRQCRRSLGLTADEVAELLGVSSAWYARFEAGRARMSLRALSRLSTVLGLDELERERLLRMALPELAPSSEAPAHAVRELRAFRRFQRRAEAESTASGLLAVAIDAVSDGIADAAFASVFLRSDRGRWFHQSHMQPDVVAALNDVPPCDDGLVRVVRARFAAEGWHDVVGSPDYGRESALHLRERGLLTELRSGFGVRITELEGYLGYCSTAPRELCVTNVVFLRGIAATVALTLRGSA